MNLNMEEEKGLPEGGNEEEEEVVQSGVNDHGTDEKEGIGGNADLGIQKSDKESGKTKVGDELTDDGSELGMKQSRIRENPDLVLQKIDKDSGKNKVDDETGRIETNVVGGGPDDLQSKADEFGKNDDLGIQGNVDSGTNQEGKENVEGLEMVGGMKAENLEGGVKEQQRENNPAVPLNKEKEIKKMWRSNLLKLRTSVRKERKLMEGYLEISKSKTMSREEIHEHVEKQLRLKREQVEIMRKTLSLPSWIADDDDCQTNRAGTGEAQGVNNE